jgi:proliferating cell nuclear antigen PCNA
MKIVISDKIKKELFISIFQVLKCCSSQISLQVTQEKFHIQGMDKSHVCLFDVNIESDWFNKYEVEENTNICFDSSIFFTVISTKNDGLDLTIYNEDEDNLKVDLTSSIKETKESKQTFNKYFKIPLIEYEYEELSIHTVEYDAEFSISAKKLCEIFSQMATFGDDICVKCTEEKIDLVTNGVTGEMLVNIPIEDLTEYSIVEGDEIDLAYSLSYINKMCLTNKLSSEIYLSLSKECPMKIKYDLGDESSLIFFIAPKIVD